MIAERTDIDTRRSSFWYPAPPIEPDARTRWSGIVPALLMAIVVAGPSVAIAWLLLGNGDDVEKAPSGTVVRRAGGQSARKEYRRTAKQRSTSRTTRHN